MYYINSDSTDIGINLFGLREKYGIVCFFIIYILLLICYAIFLPVAVLFTTINTKL